MNKKALALLSGGLDSILAVRVLQEQGIELEGINFLTVFCTCTHKGCQHAATKAAHTLKMPLKVFNITEEYLDVIRNPKHGYGSNMNPCIDCRIFIFKKAKEYMKEVGASFLVTGEVLGERPMSQRRDAIFLIEKEAGLKRLVLRPLSAKLFPPTIAEEKGIVDRDKLLAITGRSRKPQIKLAAEFGINDYPCPAGGCLLTDPGFAKRIKDLIEYDCLTLDNVRLLKFGRHFRLSRHAKLIIGRDQDENTVIESLTGTGDVRFKLKGREGPFSILKGVYDKEMIDLSAAMVVQHTKFRNEDMVEVEYWTDDPSRTAVLSAKAASPDLVEKNRI